MQLARCCWSLAGLGEWQAYTGRVEIISELQKFIREPVTLEELRDSQANYIGRLPLSLESNAGVANALLNIERFQLGLDYYQRYSELVQSVTTEMVLETARRYWHLDRLAIVSAGPDLLDAQ